MRLFEHRRRPGGRGDRKRFGGCSNEAPGASMWVRAGT